MNGDQLKYCFRTLKLMSTSGVCIHLIDSYTIKPRRRSQVNICYT